MSIAARFAYQIGWLMEGCRSVTRSLEVIRDSESTPPETRKRIQSVIDELQHTLTIQSDPSVMVFRGGGDQ